MKKLLILLMAFSLFTACNNEKSARNDRESRTDSRDKDDYRNDEDRDKDKTSDRDEDDRDRDNDRDNDRTSDDRDDDRTSSRGWSSSDVNEFVTNCVSSAVEKGMGRSAATNYCECMQKGLEKKYPNSADVGNVDMNSDAITKMVEDCLQ